MKGEFQQAVGVALGASGSGSQGVILVHSPANRGTTTGVSSPLSIFFSKFTDFDCDPTKLNSAPISEFERLAALRNWRRTGKKYVKNRKEFDIILEITQDLRRESASQKNFLPFKDPVRVFFSQFPDFHYDPTKVGATPRSEFDQIAELKGWIVGTKGYRFREKQFQHAEKLVERGRGHDPMSFFFAPWPTLTYTSTVDARTANLEFNRLSKLIGWGRLKELQRRTEFENALRFLYEDDVIQQGGGLETSSATIKSIEEGLGGVKLSEDGATDSRMITSRSRDSFTQFNRRGLLNEFFAKYPDFRYNPAARCASEFQRLCTLRRWKPGKRRFRKARMAFARAVGEELMSHLEGESGSDDDDWEGIGARDDSTAWKRMCRILNLRTVDGLRPKSKTQCKKILSGIFININDFLDHCQLGTELTRFPNLKALADYSYSVGGVFPLDAAKERELLKFLLRRISSV